MKISSFLFITLSFLLSSCLKVPSKIEPGFLGGIKLSLSNSTISSSASTLQSGDTVTISLSLKDQFGNTYYVPNSSPVVVFSISGGTSNRTFGPVTDLKNGTFTTIFTCTNAGTPITFSATVDSESLTSTLSSLTVTQGQSSSISILSGNFQIAPVAATLSSGLVVNLQDANGNPVSGVSVNWAVSSGATTYTVKYGTSSGSYPTTFASGVTGSSSVVTGLTNGTPYYFMETAQNSSGSLNASSEMAATPGQPTLSAVSDFTYGFSASDRYFDTPFTLGGLSSLT
jgi:hypothetical protein